MTEPAPAASSTPDAPDARDAPAAASESPATAPDAAQSRPSFAHASEAELARILDFYGVAWEYEPHTFPILWNLEGDVLESFSPDFYLPELELYIELTTLKQKLVRKKNRKLRRLRELYPGIRIKLFYGRDFRMLMLKFGRLALHDELAGTLGQATPPRPPLVRVLDAATDDPGQSAARLQPAAPAAAPESADSPATDADDAEREALAAVLARARRAARGRRRRRSRTSRASLASGTVNPEGG
jgi:hypothetical protein